MDADAATGREHARHRRRTRRLQHRRPCRPTPSRRSSRTPTAGSIAVINGNYALAAGLKISDALASEDANGAAAQTYANIIAVRAGDENSPKTQALLKALKTDAVKQYIADTYNGAVVASF